jgi:hypothetical protein
MARKGTNPGWPHKTTDLCHCGSLQKYADSPDIPIEFDSKLNEYHFVLTDAAGFKGHITLRHCFFCGGKAPESKRANLFATISSAEQSRLLALVEPLKTADAVMAALGPPDRDDPLGASRTEPETDGKPPVTQGYRTLVYSQLSDTADVHFGADHQGAVHVMLLGKYIGEKAATT